MIVSFDVKYIQITNGKYAKVFKPINGEWYYQKVAIEGKELREITNIVKTSEKEILNEIIIVGKKKRVIIKDGIIQYEIEGEI